MDLLRKVMNARQGGMSKAKAAEVFGIDPKTIYNWEQRADLTPCLAKTRKRKLVKVDALKLMAERDDARLGEYCLR